MRSRKSGRTCGLRTASTSRSTISAAFTALRFTPATAAGIAGKLWDLADLMRPHDLTQDLRRGRKGCKAGETGDMRRARGGAIVTLLGGGKKNTQDADLNLARKYWQEYKAAQKSSKLIRPPSWSDSRILLMRLSISMPQLKLAMKPHCFWRCEM